VAIDPVFLGYYQQLDPASPLVDAGDPTTFDADGSLADLGYYGGR
jgi:hypothetical protein